MTRIDLNSVGRSTRLAAAVFSIMAATQCVLAAAAFQAPAAQAEIKVPVAELPAAVLARQRALEAQVKKARAKGSKEAAARVLNQLGQFYFHIASIEQAQTTYREALNTARAIRVAPLEAGALNGLGDCWRSKSEEEKAGQSYQEAMRVASAAGDLLGQSAALNGLGRVASDEDDDQKAEQFHERALKLARTSGDQLQQASALNGLGIVHDDKGEAQKALDLYSQALALWRAAGDRYGEGNTLNNIGIEYGGLGETDKALDFYHQALDLRQAVGDRSGIAGTLNNLGVIYKKLGQEKKALEYYVQVLPVEQAMGNRGGEAVALNNIGNVYLQLGANREGLKVFNESLAIRQALNDRPGEAGALLNIGMAYIAMSEMQKALENLQAALALWHALGQQRGEARALNGIGVTYDDLGDPNQALEYYMRARAIYRQIGDRSGEADTLNNIAGNYYTPEEKQKALDYYGQALALEKAVDDIDGQALTLNNMGLISVDIGEREKAFDYLSTALSMWSAIGNRSGASQALDNLGSLMHGVGETKDASYYYHRALPLAEETSDPVREAQIYHNMMMNEMTEQPAAAIFHGKQAVNNLQQVRSGIKGLDKALQRSFLQSKEEYYRDLADLMIAHGRLAEAQQVLDLEKEQEYADYVRGEIGDTAKPLSLTPAEKQAAADYQRSTAETIALGREWALLKKASARTEEQQARLKQLTEQIDAANKGMDDYYKRLYVLEGGGEEANRRLDQIESQTSVLQHALARMPGTVALYTLVSKDHYRVIVITGTTSVAREYAITDADLNKKVAAFGEALRGRRQDVKELAAQLYTILVGPVKADLEQAQAETLVWSLDGVLRYLPMAALYDGKQYMVEKYNLATITPAILEHLEEKPDVSNLSVAAMGISHQYRQGLRELPAVASELDGIVRDADVKEAHGVLPGKILLNDQFTEKALEDKLGAEPAVVHIASHFVFNPGDDNQSYLLLAGRNAGGDEGGQGFPMTVADFRSNPNLTLNETALLTLSACETGKSGSAGNGREVDGLGMTAMKKGARAVISTLWSVDDASTGVLMADFYKRWADGGGKVTKAEALRLAQLDLLKNTGGSKTAAARPPTGTDRGFVTGDAQEPAPAGYANPYYWAPFVLMGNWR